MFFYKLSGTCVCVKHKSCKLWPTLLFTHGHNCFMLWCELSGCDRDHLAWKQKVFTIWSFPGKFSGSVHKLSSIPHQQMDLMNVLSRTSWCSEWRCMDFTCPLIYIYVHKSPLGKPSWLCLLDMFQRTLCHLGWAEVSPYRLPALLHLMSLVPTC